MSPRRGGVVLLARPGHDNRILPHLPFPAERLGRLTEPDGCPRLSQTHDLEPGSDSGARVPPHAGDGGWGGARTFLRDQVDIAHATLQVERRTGSGCSELDW
jgi:hypothetical protein